MCVYIYIYIKLNDFAVYLKLTQHCKSVNHLHKHIHPKDHLNGHWIVMIRQTNKKNSGTQDIKKTDCCILQVLLRQGTWKLIKCIEPRNKRTLVILVRILVKRERQKQGVHGLKQPSSVYKTHKNDTKTH